MGSPVYGKGFFDGRTTGRQQGAVVAMMATAALLEGGRYLNRKFKDWKQQRAKDAEKPGTVPSEETESVKEEMIEEPQEDSVPPSSGSA
ncbi:hypothetical protein HMPREF3088_04885 [Corynebacterium sp. HMSC22B11]|uniref:hypothetical protein n=1 Tax=unclassified Corynebacterium TaxID=2624378 RepID=UPI0008A24992|nr:MULTISPECIES: hypothetical protein [unclassified Corynebacterium]MDK8790520.1 hypothetical protein [Corynebacterium sp. MSK039]OFO14110.1 hypothetical protein HMPREF3088_04885 [Corynebacterium sp. HMSC22B11]